MSGSEAIFCGRSRDPPAARPRSADPWLVKRRIDEGCSARWNPGMGGTNRSRGEVFWDSRRGTDLPVAELLATCAMRLGAVRFAVLQRNVNHGFTIAVTTRDHLVLSWVYTDWPCASTGYPMTAPQLRLPQHVFPQRPFQREYTI